MSRGGTWEVGSSYKPLPPRSFGDWLDALAQLLRILRAADAEGHQGARDALRDALRLPPDSEAEFDLVMGGTLVTVWLRRVA